MMTLSSDNCHCQYQSNLDKSILVFGDGPGNDQISFSINNWTFYPRKHETFNSILTEKSSVDMSMNVSAIY